MKCKIFDELLFILFDYITKFWHKGIFKFGIISQIFSARGASWTLDLCEARLNHAISLKGWTQGDNIQLFIQISWNNWQQTTWATILNNDLDLSFKRNQIRLRLRKLVNIWFFTYQTCFFHIPNIVLSREIEIAKLACIFNCLTDN